MSGATNAPPEAHFTTNVMLWAVEHKMVGVNMTYRLAPANRGRLRSKTSQRQSNRRGPALRDLEVIPAGSS